MDLELLGEGLANGHAEAEAGLCYKHFRYFLKRAWREIDPAPFVDGWHIDAIADHLQAVHDGHIKNLIINIPPGLGKSMIASVLWPAWCWAKKPSLQFMGASYEAQLSTRDAVKCRQLMSTPWYKFFFRSHASPFPVKPWEFEDDQNLKTFYKNTEKGHRQAIGVGGKGTGYRGDCLAAGTVIDTEAGPIAIEALCAMAEPPRVWSLNHETGKVGLARILATSQQNKRVREIRTVAGSSIRCSDEHKIYANGDYVRSDDLKQGDALVKGRGAHLVSHEAPQVEEDSIALVGGLGRESEPVYDLQLDRNHNFFANKILVHNCLIIDDPISASDAHSKIKREAAIRWKDETMSSRFNNKEKAKEVLIMQRLHEEDLTGHLLRQGGWEHLRLPARFEVADKCKTRTWAGADFYEDRRTQEGELLFPALLSDNVLKIMKVQCGSYGFAGQYQQRPAPAEGGIIKREWFNRRWAMPGTQAPEGLEVRTVPTRYDAIAMFTDAAFKKTEDNDLVAIGVFGVKGPDVYLLQLAWERMTFSETCARIVDLHGKWASSGLAGIYVEDKANGSAVMDVLKGKIPGIIPVEPEGGKEARINAIAPFIEAGNLWLPMYAHWVEDYITEATSFPKAPHDDAIDMTAYALVRYCGQASANFLEQLSRAKGFS